jgi:hypothetical protein
MKLSETQRTVLAEIDRFGPDATFLRRSTYVKTLESLVRRELVTTELADEGRVWKCNITDKGLVTLRESYAP